MSFLQIDPGKFKSSSGQHLLRGLFLETSNNPSSVIYTLKPYKYKSLLSFPEEYLSLSDPTEYAVATELVDGLEHWHKLLECKWFKPIIERLRYELELKIRSDALRRIQTEAASDTKNTFQANKILLDYNKPKSDKGRPTKQQISDAANKQARDSALISKDYDRLLNG